MIHTLHLQALHTLTHILSTAVVHNTQAVWTTTPKWCGPHHFRACGRELKALPSVSEKSFVNAVTYELVR